MPNHVENDLVVRGKEEDLERFAARMKEGDRVLSEEPLVPYPIEFKAKDEECKRMRDAGVAWDKIPKDGFNSGGYEWCLANWGTKWGFYETGVIQQSKRKAKYCFQTAWSPAVPLVDRMAELFPELTFVWDYFEGGMGFQGHRMYEAGRLVDSFEKKYSGHRGG
jgi:hypothetical protein